MEDFIIKAFLFIIGLYVIILGIFYLKYAVKIYLLISEYINANILNSFLKKILPSFVMLTITSLVTGVPIILSLQTYLLYNQNKLVDNQTKLISKQNILNSKSNIKIKIVPYNIITDEIILKEAKDKKSYYYDIKYKIILSNSGFKTVSILDYYVYATSNLDRKIRVNAFLSKPKLLTFNGESFYLPVNLEAGKSIVFILQMTEQLMKKDYEKIKHTLIEDIGANPMILFSALENIEDSGFNIKRIISFEKLDGNAIEIEIPEKIEIKYNKENNLQ